MKMRRNEPLRAELQWGNGPMDAHGVSKNEMLWELMKFARIAKVIKSGQVYGVSVFVCVQR